MMPGDQTSDLQNLLLCFAKRNAYSHRFVNDNMKVLILNFNFLMNYPFKSHWACIRL